MADATDVSTVIDNIESDYEAKSGWTETEIGTRLDAGAVPERVIATYWRMRASAVINLVNVSESGSSRGNDAIYSRMKALADEWDGRATIIETPIAPDTRGRLSSFPIKRV